MKKQVFFTVIIVLCLVIVGSTAAQAKQLANVSSYRYYLDKETPQMMKKAKNIDMMVIEPLEMNKAAIKKMQKQGTLVFGYVNAMEVDRWNKASYKKMQKEDFYYDKAKKKKYFKEWDSYLVNMTSKHYQELLIKEVQQQVIKKDLDGVFFDTVGNIDDFVPSKQQKAYRAGMVNVLKTLKKQQPKLLIGQNWGFDTLEKATAPYVDFIMWEDFNYTELQQDDWAQQQIKRLERIRQKEHVEVFVVSFKDKQKSEKLAKKHHFKFMYNPKGSYYNEWFDK
ncbi:endo alpha-1,4 polygalactosaminidase [Brochothrix thermosphacta]|uniref:endo alpha-1,4 polygalactosaminidase n=1 Tax=Brochothrix thermosphacta TaxID=2756 RepID=UPI00083FD4A9|nr:endo alpha-1,4 polygalactosaminidase [Brochothrix thermosphacta]ODJ59952.1 hypothetical protein BFR44_02590 [Brochothrix thermosphacta]